MTANTKPPAKAAPRRGSYRHPVNKAMLEEASRGARIADAVTGFMGSWNFIAIQTVIVIIWIGGNIYLLFNFDKYPFILLNLAFSTQAAYAAPLILLAQTRQVDRDKVAEEKVEKRHETLERRAVERVAAIKAETDTLRRLIESNTDLTREDKDLTAQVHALVQEIRGLLDTRS
jgi:uncharacterized membrane protein